MPRPKAKSILNGRISGTLLTYKGFAWMHRRLGRYSHFECYCGKIKAILHTDVLGGHTISCGCLQSDKEMPQMLTYIRHDHTKVYKYKTGRGKNKTKNSYGLYRCECGTEKVVRDGAVKSNLTRSCGCMRTAKVRMKHILDRDKTRPKVQQEERIRIEEPIGSGRFKWVTEKQLEDMYYGFDQDAA